MEEEIKFTDEEMKQLYKAQIHFESVLKESRLKGAPGWLTKEVAQLYEKRFGKKLNRNYNCQVCAFSIYRIVGEQYFKQLQEKQAEVETEPAKSPKSPKKPKKSNKEDDNTER